MIQYLKSHGLKRTFEVLWTYKIGLVVDKLVYVFTRQKLLKDYIMIESHNDFDCNGGAFYEYLIKNGYNKKYKIIWAVRKKYEKELPSNVTTVRLHGPSFRRSYYNCLAKYMMCDCDIFRRMRNGQFLVYCSHGAGGLKNVKGKITIPKDVTHVLMQSDNYRKIQAPQWGLDANDSRIISVGYPMQDMLFNNDGSELKKITKNKYKKVVLWMPTFRRGIAFGRSDSTKEQKMGVPLFQSEDEIHTINNFLNKNKVLLVLKVHPKQDLSNLKVKNMSNIVVLTGDDVKKMDVDNYKLMGCVDALISDYSGAAFDFLQLNRPIGYILDDMNEYKLGFVVDDIHSLIAGKEIYSLDDFMDFLNDVVKGKDQFKKKRERIRDYIYEYHDANSSKRLAEFLGIEK